MPNALTRALPRTLVAAAPLLYGIGQFALEPIDEANTRATWTYTFQLREDRFPGSLGALGRWLLRVTFVEKDYAELMAGSARAIQARFARPEH